MAIVNSNVKDFLTKVAQGVKPNMFEVDIKFPTNVVGGKDGNELITMLCKSAALPASSVGTIEVPFRGRTVKIAGDRTFDNWTATFINDKEMKIRGIFETWLNKMNSHQGNTAELFNPASNSSDGYSADIHVSQMEKDSSDGGKDLRKYKLWYAFPVSVSQIDLAYDSNDQIEEFSVEFQYSYWTVEGSDAKNADPIP
tara:strand:+ start:382 stop:975 length:594 start_codon:yes stop_codon:yes gene_type:complete